MPAPPQQGMHLQAVLSHNPGLSSQTRCTVAAVSKAWQRRLWFHLSIREAEDK